MRYYFFCDGSARDIENLSNILEEFCLASGMQLNKKKSLFVVDGIEKGDTIRYQERLQFSLFELYYGLKYLGFYLNPMTYFKSTGIGLSQSVKRGFLSNLFIGYPREIG